MRATGPLASLAVVCVNGGSSRDVPGTWSASVEYLVRRLAPRFPSLGFAEVRYRIKSWNRLDMCTADAVAAVEAAVGAGARRVLLLGYSMGGAVAIRAAAGSRSSTGRSTATCRASLASARRTRGAASSVPSPPASTAPTP